MAVHGTNRKAWASIGMSTLHSPHDTRPHPSTEKQGLSKMTRNHIHIAQGFAGDTVISGTRFTRHTRSCFVDVGIGMRNSADIFIYIDLQKALDAGYKFQLSANGVILTAGDEMGFLPPEFFARVERRVGKSGREPLPGWEGVAHPKPTRAVAQSESDPVDGCSLEVVETQATVQNKA